MRVKNIKGVGLFLCMLAVSMPICLASEMSLTYDSNGNLVTGDGKYRTYNSLNQLWRVYNGSNSSGYLIEEYMYHPVEERVWLKKTYNSSGSLIETVYYLDSNQLKVINSSGTFNYTYVYLDGQLVAQNSSGVKTYSLTDLKGDVVVVTNSSGSVVERTTYDPFGEVISGGSFSRFNYEGKENFGSGVSNFISSYSSMDDNSLNSTGYTFYNGVASGAVQSINGKFGSAEYFDGNNDYVNTSKSVLSSSNFTLSFWSYTPSANNNTGYIFCDSNNASNFFFRRYDNGATFNGWIGGTDLGNTSIAVPRDTWIYTALILSGGNVSIYVNGIKQNMSGTTTGLTFNGLTTSLFMGNRLALDRDYEGYIDNVRTYSRALSQSEILNIYANESYHPIIKDNLVSSYGFEQGTNDTNNILDGKYVGAYWFKNNGTFVNIPDSPSINLTGEITISAWIKPYAANQAYVISKNRAYVLQFLGSSYGNATEGAIYSGGSWTPLIDSTSIPLNVWTHVAFTYDQKTAKIYLNGVLSNSTAKTNVIDTSTSSLVLGGKNTTDRTRDFNGSLDDVTIYNKALTAEQVANIYTKGHDYYDNTQTNFNARLLNNRIKQLEQPDPELPQVWDPQQLNHYSFERSNPFKFIDSSGHRVTYAVEKVGNDDILAIYVNGQYAGRVVDEVRETTMIPTQFGYSVLTSTADYVVQPGSKSNAGRTTMTASSYDSRTPTIMLSQITKQDPKTDEKTEIGIAILEDTLGVVSGAKEMGVLRNIPAVVSQIEKVSQTKTFIEVGISKSAKEAAKNVLGFIPGGSTYNALTDKSGYSAYTPIPEYCTIKQPSQTVFSYFTSLFTFK